jgi:hypothetical protein
VWHFSVKSLKILEMDECDDDNDDDSDEARLWRTLDFRWATLFRMPCRWADSAPPMPMMMNRTELFAREIKIKYIEIFSLSAAAAREELGSCRLSSARLQWNNFY